VINEIRDSAYIASVAAKIVDAIAQPIIIGENKLASSASIGIAVFPDNGEDRNSLMKSADIAMYHAKAAGRGVYRFFDNAMMAAASARLEMEAALREAIPRGELVLHFQPLLEMGGGVPAVTGFEALIRWQKPGGALIPPASFIPLAEACGLIAAIGEYALRSACHTVQGWRRDGFPALRVSVNISARELVNPDFFRTVAQVLAESGLPADCLELEITESAAMQDPEVSIANLSKLKALGISIAIDDFGTGYSSLAYLKLLPIDRIKLDRTFVKDIETDPNDAAICTATIGLAHNLGLRVVAEGVENIAQLDYLTRLGCDTIQGFYFSRPLPAGAALDYLRSFSAGR
jgi:predicted signal transduction protein with EAL and GGDEF domain